MSARVSVRFSLSGHDMNGFALGPDGRIYGTIGDRGFNIVTREGVKYEYPDQGAVFRFDPDGSNFEVVHTGLRNPKEIAFFDRGPVDATRMQMGGSWSIRAPFSPGGASSASGGALRPSPPPPPRFWRQAASAPRAWCAVPRCWTSGTACPSRCAGPAAGPSSRLPSRRGRFGSSP